MNGVYRKVEAVLTEYSNLEEKFLMFISDTSDDSPIFKGLSIETREENCIVAHVLGKTVRIHFEFVLESPEKPLGQITSALVRKRGALSEEEYPFFNRWFDYLGNVFRSPDEESAMHNIGINNYLRQYLYEMTNELMRSEYMEPRKM